MSEPHWCVVLNGKCAGDEPFREAVAAMRASGVRLDVRITWEAGDAERHVDEAIREGVGAIIAVGGDGTLSEIVGALARREANADVLPSVGLVPLGTANDFAGAAQIPIEPLPALRLIRDRPAQAIDVLRIDADGAEHWCVNMLSAGFGAQISADTNADLKRHLGGVAYLLTGIAELGKVEAKTAAVRTSEGFEWHGSFIAMGCGNGRQAGGGHALCPNACIDDGMLDVTIVPPPDGDLLSTLGTLLTEGTAAAMEKAAVRTQSRWVEIRAEEAIAVTTDGEASTVSTLRVDCVPARLRMHLPVECPLMSAAAGEIHLPQSDDH